MSEPKQISIMDYVHDLETRLRAEKNKVWELNCEYAVAWWVPFICGVGAGGLMMLAVSLWKGCGV